MRGGVLHPAPHFIKNCKSMKIQAKDKSIKSMKLCVPFDGVITIDEKGVADVSAKCAEELVKKTNDWEYVGKPAKEEGKPAEAEKETAEEETEESVEESEEYEEDDDADEEITPESLELLKVDELRAMCKEGNYPKKEWKDLNKSELITYILEKIKK